MRERKWILYLAGPMTGYPQFNIPAFERAADELRQRGHMVINPVEEDSEETREAALGSSTGSLDHLPPGESWGRMIGRDVAVVADDVEGVVLLPGWEKSPGARLEVFTALTANKPVWELGTAVERGYRFDYTTELDPQKAAEVFACYVTQTEIPDIDALPETPCHGCDTLCASCDEAALAKTARELGISGHTHSGPFSVSMDKEKYEEMFHGRPAVIDGEVRVTSETGGQKGRKPARMDLIPPKFLLALSEVYGMGAEKYDDHNYLKGYDWSLSYGAMLRHLMAWAAGEELDPESGLPHLGHAAWHCAALFTFQTEGLGTDDRIVSAVEGVDSI